MVPYTGEVGVEGDAVDLQEVLEARGDDCDEGDVVGGCEPKDVSVDEDGHHDGVEEDEESVDGCFGVQGGALGDWPYAIDEFLNHYAEDNIDDCGSDDDHVLDGLFDVDASEVISAGGLYGRISEGVNQMCVTVTRHDEGAPRRSCSSRCVGIDTQSIAVA